MINFILPTAQGVGCDELTVYVAVNLFAAPHEAVRFVDY